MGSTTGHPTTMLCRGQWFFYRDYRWMPASVPAKPRWSFPTTAAALCPGAPLFPGEFSNGQQWLFIPSRFPFLIACYNAPRRSATRNVEVPSLSAPTCPVPELLAPAGDWDALRAAVANGADAVYFGLSNFNARHRATNFTIDELPQVMAYLHERNVRGYVAFNTLIFSD